MRIKLERKYWIVIAAIVAIVFAVVAATLSPTANSPLSVQADMATPTVSSEWYDNCPVCPTYPIQPTFTPGPTPTCRPCTSPTPYPASTAYPPQPPCGTPLPTPPPTQTGTPSPSTPTPDVPLSGPLYGMAFVPAGDLGTVKDMGIQIVQHSFPHDGTPKNWLAYLDAAQAQDIKVIAWLWPQGWTWDGAAWHIDDQARLFFKTVHDHPALLAAFLENEPCWTKPWRDPYEDVGQMVKLYQAVKGLVIDGESMADLTLYVSQNKLALCKPAIRDNIVPGMDTMTDIYESWYYIFDDGNKNNWAQYEADKQTVLTSNLNYELDKVRAAMPDVRFFWKLHAYELSSYGYRMPTCEEIIDWGCTVLTHVSPGGNRVDGVLWYTWGNPGNYPRVLSNSRYDDNGCDRYDAIRLVKEKYDAGLCPDG